MKSRIAIVALLLVGCAATPDQSTYRPPTRQPDDYGPVNETEASPEFRQAVSTWGFQWAESERDDIVKAMYLEQAMNGDTLLANRFQHRLNDVRPEWVEFIKANCTDPVINSLASPSTAKIASMPKYIFASYDRTANVTMLDALGGKVDAQNAFGAMLRCDYYLSWSKAGPPDSDTPWKVPYVFVAPPLQR